MRLLRNGIDDARVHAAAAIAHLASGGTRPADVEATALAGNTDAQATLVAQGALPLLLAMLPLGKTQTAAAGALAGLAAFNRPVQEAIAREGAVAPLLNLLNAVNVPAQASVV